jgi:hypothetical protein
MTIPFYDDIDLKTNQAKNAADPTDAQDLVTKSWAEAAIAAAGWQGDNIYFVGKGGSDTNDGLSPGTAFLTFNKAITVINALTGGDVPSPTNRYVIFGLDAGIYSESCAVPAWVAVQARMATLVGNHTVDSGSGIEAAALSASSGICVSKSGTHTENSAIVVGQITVTGTADCCFCDTQEFFIEVKKLEIENGNGLEVDSGGVIDATILDAEISGTGSFAVADGAGSTVNVVARHLQDTGSGTGFEVSNTAHIHAISDVINLTTLSTFATNGIVGLISTHVENAPSIPLAAGAKYHIYDVDNSRWINTGPLHLNQQKIVDLLDPTADQDAATKKYVDDNTIGAGYEQASSDGASSTTSATYVVKLTHTTASLPAGTYRIGYSVESYQDSGNREVGVRFRVEGTTEGETYNEVNDTDEVFANSGFKIYTLASPGTITADIYFRRGSGGTAFVRRARLEFYRVG